MKNVVLLLAAITLAGCSQPEAPSSDPKGFAPHVTFDEAPESMPGNAPSQEEAKEEAAPQAPEPVEETRSGAPRDEALDSQTQEGGGAREKKEVRSQEASGDGAADSDTRRPPKLGSSTTKPAIACDASCHKLCDAQVDQQACAKAYNAGCFSGNAPATVDCGKYQPSGAEKSGNGVETQSTPRVEF